ncbi:unnamed protein product [Moneuplotes crassus]|uniref:Uncharacterized protein n=1 Tax=Euplotes crassus TaxID=5936 RepID=A0AAD1XGS3_EUPCR|nr:unnamed protein product [Moneuplotes crassus]
MEAMNMKAVCRKERKLSMREKAISLSCAKSSKYDRMNIYAQSYIFKSYILKLEGYTENKAHHRIFDKDLNCYLMLSQKKDQEFNFELRLKKKFRKAKIENLGQKIICFKPDQILINSGFENHYSLVNRLFNPVIRMLQNNLKDISIENIRFTSKQLSVLFYNFPRCETVFLYSCILDTFTLRYRERNKYNLKTFTLCDCLDKHTDYIWPTHGIFSLILTWISFPRISERFKTFTFSAYEWDEPENFMLNLRKEHNLEHI